MIRVEGDDENVPPAVGEIVLNEAHLTSLPVRAPSKIVDSGYRPNYEGLNLNVASD